MASDINLELNRLSGNPIPHRVLMTLLKEYRRPNDKISELVKAQVLTPVKKGLYLTGPAVRAGKPEPYLVANCLYGPSYVSLETALSFHGMIPEKVYAITSMTTKATRSFDSPAGNFSYTRLPLPYYAYGIEQLHLPEKRAALIASKEKALCDKIVTTAGVIFRSKHQALTYLLDDLRLDESGLKALDGATIRTWIAHAPKKSSLQILVNLIQTL